MSERTNGYYLPFNERGNADMNPTNAPSPDMNDVDPIRIHFYRGSTRNENRQPAPSTNELAVPPMVMLQETYQHDIQPQNSPIQDTAYNAPLRPPPFAGDATQGMPQQQRSRTMIHLSLPELRQKSIELAAIFNREVIECIDNSYDPDEIDPDEYFDNFF